MDKFIVSARKYRPQNFSTVIGQSHITTTLKNAINNNQLAHAFLFCGPRGVGKTTCARILAKTINCENRDKDGEACNKCNSCESFDHGTSFNIFELDAASNNGVDKMKHLTDQVRFAPQGGKYKVYIIDEVHMLTSQAFNAFLKTLEEPPPYAIFILATTEKHKILPTILSRCQIFDFKRITPQDTVEHLEDICSKENITAEKAALHVIATKSEGCLRDALSILDKIVSFTGGKITYKNTLENLNILDEDYFFKLLEQLKQQQLADSLLLYDEINQKGFEGDILLEGFAEFIRNLLVSKDAKAVKLLEVADDFKPKYISSAATTDTGGLIASLNIISETAIQYKQARNKKLHIELALIKLAYLSQAIEISLDNDSISKKKTTDQVKAISFKSLPSFVLQSEKKSADIVLKKPTATIKPIEKAVLVIEEPNAEIKKQTPVVKPVIAELKKESPMKMGSLIKIREQIAQQNNLNNGTRALDIDTLTEAWNLYIEKITAASNHTAVTNFKLSTIQITDENNFEIITDTVIQQRFIEAERSELVSYMQQYFNNIQLKYKITINEKGPDLENGPKPITAKEHYKMLTEEYPLIKELKEKLKLDLEY
jgi:DNA polymerase-3 subunit gamma/tau